MSVMVYQLVPQPRTRTKIVYVVMTSSGVPVASVYQRISGVMVLPSALISQMKSTVPTAKGSSAIPAFAYGLTHLGAMTMLTALT